MSQKQLVRDRTIWAVIFVILAATLGIDAFTPLGYSVWCFYFFAVGLTVFQSRRDMPFIVAFLSTVLVAIGYKLSPPSVASSFSGINRTIGALSFWGIAALVAQALRARMAAERMLWLHEGHNAVALALRGEQTPEEIGSHALRALCRRLDAQVGALYRVARGQLVLCGGAALPADHPATLPREGGLLGDVLAEGQVRRVGGLADTHLALASTLGRTAPSELFLMPVTADGRTVGVIEIGRIGGNDLYGADLELLERTGETIGVALRTSAFRQRQNELLEETQRQSEELQTQQEELRVANEELEEQSRSLQQSHASLEAQQAELEQTNVQLEERTHDLERQRQTLVMAQADLARNARKLEATSRYKSEFLANMSHELRTPLNSSLILAKLLVDNKDGTLTDEQVRYASAIHASNNDLLTLINDILDLSRIEAGHVEIAAEPLSVDAVLERVRETFAPLTAEKGLALRIELAPGAPTRLVGDEQRLRQVVKNLVANAVKFTESGEVALRVDAAPGGRVRFTVSDTGIGIDPAQLGVIFEAFRQADGSTSRKFGGSGLGLSISRDLAQRMGGDITVASEPGRGSTFTLELPVDGTSYASEAPATGVPAPAAEVRVASRPAAAVPPKAPAAPTPAVHDDRTARQRPGRLILVVEDDTVFARSLVDLAHELDFDCIVAGTADEALALAAVHSPSGVLLDIGLPDVSGLSVLERLKRDPATRHIPVHVVSATEQAHMALELGAVGHLLKPASREHLVNAIARLEDRHQRTVRRLLIVEDDAELRNNLTLLLARDQLEIVAVGSIHDALENLSSATFDCLVMDLVLPDGTGYDLLEHMAASEAFAFPPVIVYTGRSLTREEEQRLRRYSRSIIIKGARSPERLLDEVTLFLHSVEASLPTDQQRLLKEARKRDAMLDGRTVLLAEDDVRNIFALTSVLEPLGVRLEIARNGREAVERLVHTEVDLVLMDIMMPEMDGLEAMRRIRADARLADLPIIALTAKAMSDDRERCIEAGANDYIAKPIDVDKLVSLCRVWCSRR
ncbi:response regulator [Luteibacter aegosomatissinici]|uniref:response regulator n=1 Tax=Luteibacter aegosomatissinici TaxID=2911539 RepID=UPI001FFA30F2|nr:response regulator [Luteibacter aegosomatissinici]UPG92520.1 response regulator [Luteibacter aegosomatissinici]